MFVHTSHMQYHNQSIISGDPLDNVTDHVTLPDLGYVEYTRSYRYKYII